MSKVNIRNNFELKSAEASVLILNVLKREGFYEDDVRGFIVWVTDGIQNKVTIHEKEIFEKKIIEIIQKYKEELQKKDYREVREKAIELFRDKRKKQDT